MLYIFSGLPGTGKSTLSAGLCQVLRAAYLRVDVVEQAMRVSDVCSDDDEHRHRIVSRVADIAGLVLPTWEEVKSRRYDVWDRDHIVIDTAHQTVSESLLTLFEQAGLA